MSIILEVNGIPYNNFLSAEIEVRLDVLCNSFSFTASRNMDEALPFSVGDDCRVFVNSVLVLTGSIELLSIKYSNDKHTIEISGRDNTSDLLDSNIDELLSDIGEGITLKKLIEQVIEHIGSSLKVVDNSGGVSFNPSNDIASPEPGDNAFKFCETLARQKQVLLTSNGDGDVVITRGTPVQLEGAVLQNSIGAKDNNILNATMNYDNTGRYNLYAITGQGNPSALVNSGAVDIDSVINREGRTNDNSIRAGRQLILSAESSFSDEDNFDRAKWEANIRKARGRVYSPEVFEFSFTGKQEEKSIWIINRLVMVLDDFAGISGNMLVNSVLYMLSDVGSRTKLTLLEPDAFSLALEEPVSEGL